MVNMAKYIIALCAIGGVCLAAEHWQAPDAASILCPVVKGDKKAAAEQKKAAAFEKRLQAIDKGIDALDASGKTMLMQAADMDNRLAVCYLIAMGADAMVKNKAFSTALGMAHSVSVLDLLTVCKTANETISHEGRQKIAREMGLEDPGTQMVYLKDVLSRPDKLKTIADVLKLGVKLDEKGVPAFHELKGVTPEYLALLVRKGYDINTRGEDGKVKLPLDNAVAKLALALGQKMDDADDATLLRAAVLTNDTKAVKDMLKKDATLAGAADDLLAIAQSGEMVRELSAAGAKAEPAEAGQASLLRRVICDGSIGAREAEVVQALLEAGASADKDILLCLCKQGSADDKTIQRLLKAGADAKAVDEEGNTPLHYAAARGKAEAVKVLCAGGADPNAVNTEGDTPLLFALRHIKWSPHNTDKANMIMALFKGGANPKIKGKDGQHALQLAKSLGLEGEGKVIKHAASKQK